MNSDQIDEERKIASNLIYNIEKCDLINRDISSLDRIIQIYFSQDHNTKEEKQIIDFLFQCLDEHGSDYSILFTHLSNSREIEKVIIRLHESKCNSSLFEISYQMIEMCEAFKSCQFDIIHTFQSCQFIAF